MTAVRAFLSTCLLALLPLGFLAVMVVAPLLALAFYENQGWCGRYCKTNTFRCVSVGQRFRRLLPACSRCYWACLWLGRSPVWNFAEEDGFCGC